MRRTLGPYAEGVPSILYVPTFPWKYFFCMKQERTHEIIRGLFPQGEVLILVGSPQVQEHSGAHWLPLPQENTLLEEPPLQLYLFNPTSSKPTWAPNQHHAGFVRRLGWWTHLTSLDVKAVP